jgi:hypothetical protein
LGDERPHKNKPAEEGIVAIMTVNQTIYYLTVCEAHQSDFDWSGFRQYMCLSSDITWCDERKG